MCVNDLIFILNISSISLSSKREFWSRILSKNGPNVIKPRNLVIYNTINDKSILNVYIRDFVNQVSRINENIIILNVHIQIGRSYGLLEIDSNDHPTNRKISSRRLIGWQ